MFSSNTSAVSGDANYIEDVFSTWLYNGTSATQSINNGIDLAGKGGLVWIKSRDGVGVPHNLADTARGANKMLFTDSTSAEFVATNRVTAFNANGFSIGNDTSATNNSAQTYASWTFRKQPKFFDVVTYTGNGSTQTISHNLGAVPGCIIIKCINDARDWQVYHRSLANTEYMVLNSTAAKATGTTRWNSTTPTATAFTVGSDLTVNGGAGRTYVAYLFAHNAGGFGLTGTDNVISCGSYTGNGSATGPEVDIGYEPQWVLIKRVDAGPSYWTIFDTMRGFSVGTDSAHLYPNTSNLEDFPNWGRVRPYARGFQPLTTDNWYNSNGSTYIYIAIRRGPMKTPTTGTSVFSPISNAVATNTAVSTGFPLDLQFTKNNGTTGSWYSVDRLRGMNSTTSDVGVPNLFLNLTDAENTSTGLSLGWNNTGYLQPSGWNNFQAVRYNFRRAPGFFDVVCADTAGTTNHNLGVVPELIIMKRRDGADAWYVVSSGLGSINADFIRLNTDQAKVSAANNQIAATSTTFNTSYFRGVGTWVNYLFASCPGVSKVGSYTGTGTTQQINCGFTGGARFVLIKRTDSTGDWYVWDSARGIVAGNDPYLLLNSTAAEVTNTDYVDTFSSGFEISSTAPAAINANGGTFIYLAIA